MIQRIAANPWLVAVVVSLATFMEVLDTTIVNVSITHIAGSLAATPDEGTWVLTSYLVANGIVLPLSGWLAEVIGRKRFFMMCIAGFTLASLLCGIASSLEMLIVCRLFQGLFGGGLQPMQQAIVLDSFPPSKRGAAFGLMGITLIVAPVLGPTLGGWITDTYSWHWVFLINIPVGIAALAMVWQVVQDPEHAKAKGFSKGGIDFMGLGLIALGLGTMQVMLDKGQTEDWFESNFIIAMAVICSLCLGSAIAWLLRQKDPVVDLRLLADRSFGMGSVLIFFTGFVLYASSALLPLLVQTQFGYDATLAGLVLSPGALALLFLMPVAGQLVNRVQAKRLIFIGLSLCGAGMFATSFLSPDIDFNTLVMMRALQVLGLPFLFIPVSTLAFMDVPKEKSGKASALFSLSRNLGGSVGIAVVASFVSRHTQMHHNVLADHAVPGDPMFMERLDNARQTLIGHGVPPGAEMGVLYQQMQHQAALLAYQDAFQLMTGLMIFGALMALFLPSNDPKAHGDAPPAH